MSQLYLMLALCLVSSLAFANGVDREKVKTGILPDGGFYSLYEYRCVDGATVVLASMERRTRWCTSLGDELRCTGSARQAHEIACSLAELADSAEQGRDAASPGAADLLPVERVVF